MESASGSGEGMSRETPEQPEFITIEIDPKMYQTALKLVPVGRDEDCQWEPIQ